MCSFQTCCGAEPTLSQQVHAGRCWGWRPLTAATSLLCLFSGACASTVDAETWHTMQADIVACIQGRKKQHTMQSTRITFHHFIFREVFCVFCHHGLQQNILAKLFCVIFVNCASFFWAKEQNQLRKITSNNRQGNISHKHSRMISSKKSRGIICVIHKSPMVNINFLVRIFCRHSWPFRLDAQGSKSFSPSPGPQKTHFWCGHPRTLYRKSLHWVFAPYTWFIWQGLNIQIVHNKGTCHAFLLHTKLPRILQAIISNGKELGVTDFQKYVLCRASRMPQICMRRSTVYCCVAQVPDIKKCEQESCMPVER